jgi:hypothetical protein
VDQRREDLLTQAIQATDDRETVAGAERVWIWILEKPEFKEVEKSILVQKACEIRKLCPDRDHLGNIAFRC